MASSFARFRRLLPTSILVLCVILASCAETDESRVEDTVDALVEALDDGDSAAVARLFTGGVIEPRNAAGDSSIVYRLVTTAGGSDYRADNLTVMVLGERANAQLVLSGDVRQGGDVKGEMYLPMRFDLERSGDEWRIVSGSDAPNAGGR